jgi:DMSO/TMAO reductase YedYZ molybdopterin-dependent catalytic subunit
MPAIEGWGGVMNSAGVISGPFMQKGVSIMTLLDRVGGIGEGDAVRITGKDGYSMTYSYSALINGDFITLDVSDGKEVPHDKLTAILCYEEDGKPLPDTRGPLRVAILGSKTQVTEGHWWTYWVKKIEIVPSVKPWTLSVAGFIDEKIDLAGFESCSSQSCHGTSWTDDQKRVWDGIPLWLLVGRVDDANSHSNETKAFNDATADAGYEVQVVAADGYSQTFTSSDIKRNNNVIVSFRRDGGPLPENQWPLRLVGPNMSSKQMVGQITSIRVVFSGGEK